MEPSGSLPTSIPRARRSKASRIGLGILVGVVAGNALAAGTYLVTNGIASEAPAPPAPAETSVGAVSSAHRLAGLEAMERNDYATATKEFTAALKAPRPAQDLPQLLGIVEGLARQVAERPAAPGANESSVAEPKADAAPPAAPQPVRAAARPRPEKRATTAKAQRRAPEPRAAPPEPEPAPVAAPVEATAKTKAADKDELPLCPEGWTPPKPKSPYAALPRRCRPRDDASL